MADRRPVLLITGASVGIGRAVAERFARNGYDVAGGSRRPERLEGVRAAVEAAGGRFLPVIGDVRDPAVAHDAVASVLEAYDRLDVLVNNAAAGFPCRADDLTPNGFRAMVDITFGGTFWFSQAAHRAMEGRGGGTIINMASIAGLRPSQHMAIYGAAKAAVIALTRALAVEWGPDVRVVAVAPGTIVTEGMEAVLDEAERELRTTTFPMRRLGEVDDIAAAVEYLATPAAAWVTGTTLVIDGGQTAAVRHGG